MSGICGKEYAPHEPPEHAIISRLLLYHGFRSVDEIVSETHLPQGTVTSAVNNLWGRHDLLRMSHDGVTRYVPCKQRPFETLDSVVSGNVEPPKVNIDTIHINGLNPPQSPFTEPSTPNYSSSGSINPPTIVPPTPITSQQQHPPDSLYRRAVFWLRYYFT